MEDKELLTKQITGLLLGTAVGDSIGLPFEGIKTKRVNKLLRGKIQHNLIITPWQCYGLCSDDTEHARIVGQSILLMQPKSVESFLKPLAHYLRSWFLSLPAGTGKATLKACVKLCLGCNPKNSGVNSAGNGPAMRAAIIGCFFADNLPMMEQILNASTSITHKDTKALEGAWIIAMAAAYSSKSLSQQILIEDFLKKIIMKTQGQQLKDYLLLAQQRLQQQVELADYLSELGLTKGVTGYINHTVAAVIYAWLRYYGDYQKTISVLIEAGGDTDTTAAIAGALSGINVGKEGIPQDWLKGVKDWPASIGYLEKLAAKLVEKKLNFNRIIKAPKLFWPYLFVRNLIFLLIVLLHCFRRLLPPY